MSASGSRSLTRPPAWSRADFIPGSLQIDNGGAIGVYPDWFA
jgi:hypothetical protein